MARHGQLAAAAEGEAVHRGDHGATGGLELPEDVLPTRRQRPRAYRVCLREFADVRASHERPPRAGEQDPAYVVARLDLVHHLAQPANDLRVERVELVRTVDRDGGDAVGDGEGDGHKTRDQGKGTRDQEPQETWRLLGGVGCK